MTERGLCSVCGKEYTLTKNVSGRYGIRQHGKPICPGTGQAPKAQLEVETTQPSTSSSGVEIVYELWGYRPKQKVIVDGMGGKSYNWNFVSARLVDGEPKEVTLYGGKGQRLQLRTVTIDRLRPPKKTLTPKKN